MVTAKLVHDERLQQQPGQAAQVRGFTPLDTSVYDDVVCGSIDDVREEIDAAFADMKTCYNTEPDHAMRLVQGHSARLSELRVRIQRIEDYKREWKNVRTREIEPALEELERQYTIASRLLSARELDWRIESGDR